MYRIVLFAALAVAALPVFAAAQSYAEAKALADRDERRCAIVAVAVEQHAGVAFAQAQYAGQVRGGGLGQDDARARLQLRIDEATGQAHAVAASMTASVVSASRASCASSMQYGGIQYSTSPSGRSTTPRASAAR